MIRLHGERGVGRGVERGAEVKLGERLSSVVDKENLPGIGALHRENEAVVSRKSVGRIDADLAAAESVRSIEAEKLDLSAAVFRNIHRFGLQRFSVQKKGHGALRRRRIESGDHGLQA